VEGKSPPCRQGSDQGQIAVGFSFPKAVMKMGHQDLQSPGPVDFQKQVKERDRIRTAGNRHQDPVAGFHHVVKIQGAKEFFPNGHCRNLRRG
jgi:hypothetical protein